MLNFITLTLSIAAGIILASIVMLTIMLILQPVVMKWSAKQTMKMFESLEHITDEKEGN